MRIQEWQHVNVTVLVNPRRACARGLLQLSRVSVCVCVSVCVSVCACFSVSAGANPPTGASIDV